MLLSKLNDFSLMNCFNSYSMKSVYSFFLFLLLPLLSFADSKDYINNAISLFCNSSECKKPLETYYENIKLTETEKIDIAFLSLDKLLDNPQIFSLLWGWKISLLRSYIDSLDVDKIPLRYVPILFKALKVGSVTPTGDVMVICCLEKIIGGNVGYTLSYLESKNNDLKSRLLLIDKWEILFENNKNNILKTREYKKRYFGKNVSN